MCHAIYTREKWEYNAQQQILSLRITGLNDVLLPIVVNNSWVSVIIGISLVFGSMCIQFDEICSLPQGTKQQYV